MRERRRRLISEESAGGAILLNLSLFLMLLAFFIVLNGISSFDEMRYKPIVESLITTFAVSPDRGDLAPSVTPDPARSINEGSAVERIEALFNAQITGFDATSSIRGGIMHVEVPLEEFDRAMRMPGQIDLTKAERVTGLQTFFVPTLVSLLREAEKGRPYRLDILMQTADSPALLYNSDPLVLRERMNVAGDYALLLQQQGLPASLLGIGVREGDPENVALFFQPLDRQRETP